MLLVLIAPISVKGIPISHLYRLLVSIGILSSMVLAGPIIAAWTAAASSIHVRSVVVPWVETLLLVLVPLLLVLVVVAVLVVLLVPMVPGAVVLLLLSVPAVGIALHVRVFELLLVECGHFSPTACMERQCRMENIQRYYTDKTG